ncbi:MAG: hypothetical protein JW910_02725 [Anaerolineae bacterium]|nr:hypothetical protein [Anaerolineae bacterium]
MLRHIRLMMFLLAMLFLTSSAIAQTGVILFDWLTDPTCLAACYFGIEPGVTHPDEIEPLLDAANLVYSLGPAALPDLNRDYPLRYMISPEDNTETVFPFLGEYGDIVIIFMGNQIDSIVIDDVAGVTVDDVLDAFGAPSRIVDAIFSYDLLYVDERLVFSVNKQQPSSAIELITILSPPTLDFCYFQIDDIVDIQPCSEPEELCNIETSASDVPRELIRLYW